ncbi:uncharacterized protein E0L32_011063 [Thyridium curvatum]|uniref:Zn(2)-C6 fungal-type domain-containing protein n=1 Tax=Thyridium curvatum TaxID=1093900 RepID=A0A507ADC2_9PEZI|nr:uncharacterized protein E0L32_011063 [Thyridium curvatum]TPX06995.1 hypothetical protein E0L32_011063 [Thyridium curvatum]
MSPEPPAGYFSTFSILDPNNTSPEGHPRSQKRNRRVFVCIPCHKRKLKCDKRLPCSRCVASGNAEDCVYQPFPSSPKQDATPERETPAMTPPRSAAKQYIKARVSPATSRFPGHGSTYWATVASEFEEAVPFIFGTDTHWEPRYRQIKNLKFLFPALSGMNYPFGNSSPYAATKTQIVDSLPPRHIVEALVSSYMNSIELTHGLLHPLLIQNELDYFWKNRHGVLDGWLAQLLMMLALGAQSMPDYILDGAGRSKSQWTDFFLESAQISLSRSPFMAAPDITTVRTLCMMVIAQMTELRGGDPNQLTCAMGFTTRMAISLQLHRSTSLFPEISQVEAEMRKRVWFTLQLLDLDVAMRAGTSHLFLDGDVDQPVNVEPAVYYGTGCSWSTEEAWAGSYTSTDLTYHTKVAEIVPLLAEVINTVNSPTRPFMDYGRVLEWHARIREELRDAEAAILSEPPSQLNFECSSSKANYRLQFLKVLMHRALLALHHAHSSSSSVNTPAEQQARSRAASLRSAMALLDIQHAWSSPYSACPSETSGSSSTSQIAAAAAAPPSVHSSPTMIGGPHHEAEQQQRRHGWLVDLCHDDFAAAMIHVIVGARRHDLDALAVATKGGGGGGLPGTAADDVLSALRLGMAVVRDRACRSVCHFKEFTGLSILCSCLRGLKSGQPLLPRVLETADDIEQVILVGKHDMIWADDNMALMQQDTPQTAGLMVLDHELLGDVFA